MRLALGHPTLGYYTRAVGAGGGDVFGRAGDFTTSPEVSQMFGELVGVWLVAAWQQQLQQLTAAAAGQLSGGAPAHAPPPRFRLVELGPGRGTLAADILRVASRFPQFAGACAGLHLVETSPTLRLAQARALGCEAAAAAAAAAATAVESGSRTSSHAGRPLPVTWHDRLADVPRGEPLLVVAHELFDALPVHQFVRLAGGGWRERLVDVSGGRVRGAGEGEGAIDAGAGVGVDAGASGASAGGLRLVLAPGPTPASAAYSRALDARCAALAGARGGGDSVLPAGAIVEFSPAAAGLAGELGAALSAHGGAALIVDYGFAPGESSAATGRPSLRGIRGHAFTASVLEAPGEVDLSADVDFGVLAEAAVAGGAPSPGAPPRAFALSAYGPITQGAFLQRMGLAARLARLCAAAPPAEQARLQGEAQRLAHPEQMGSIYKALALVAVPSGASKTPSEVCPPAFEGAEEWMGGSDGAPGARAVTPT